MFKEEELNEKITIDFLLLMTYVKYKNKHRKHTDPNRIIEKYLANLFNKTCETNYIVGDLIPSEDGTFFNQPAVDLLDTKNKIAIQVTSSNDWSKITYTTNQFEKEKLYETFDDLIVLIVNEKKKYRGTKKLKKSCRQKGYNLHIKDFSDLIDVFIDSEDSIKNSVCEFNRKYLNSTLTAYIQDFEDESEYSVWDTAQQFREHLSDSSDGYLTGNKLESYLEELLAFTIKLSQIPISTRKILYIILKYNIEYSVDSGVIFDGIKILKKSALTNTDFKNELIILMNEGFRIDDLEDNNKYRLSYDITTDKYDLFSELIDFCENYDIPLKKLLVNLEFNLLD